MKFSFMILLSLYSMSVSSNEVLKRMIEENTYTIDRGFNKYAYYFGPTFVGHVKSLQDTDHWIDGGSGNSFAQKDFLKSTGTKAPYLTAITVKYPESMPKTLNQNKFKVLSGRYFEEIPNEELRKADVITDVVGILNYSSQIDLVLEKYIDLLKTEGVLYVHIPWTSTTVETKSGLKLTLRDWIKRIPGLRMIPLKDRQNDFKSSAFKVTACGIQVPKLKLLHAAQNSKANYIVFRHFKEI